VKPVACSDESSFSRRVESGRALDSFTHANMGDMNVDSPLVFVYNADSGLFNAVSDVANKIFSPGTYACRLCALTHSHFGMRREWTAFLNELPGSKEFLHADELLSRYGVSGVPLPAVFERQGDRLTLRLAADEISACSTMNDLQELIKRIFA
jgi:hypothetical protein